MPDTWGLRALRENKKPRNAGFFVERNMNEGAAAAIVMGGCHALKSGPVRACGRVRLRAKRTRLRWYSYWKTPVMYQQRAHLALG